MYKLYMLARDMAWIILLQCGITTLPVDLGKIARLNNIKTMLYSECFDLFPLSASDDGFIALITGVKIIFLNDTIKTTGRRRFTLAHELGHALLDHPLDYITTRNSEYDSENILEQQANVFARDILMPACVLNAIGAYTPQQIAKGCNVSLLSATIRAERLAVLRERNKFGTSPLERQVLEQFQPYIDSYNLNLN